jgi:hypothetical protein
VGCSGQRRHDPPSRLRVQDTSARTLAGAFQLGRPGLQQKVRARWRPQLAKRANRCPGQMPSRTGALGLIVLTLFEKAVSRGALFRMNHSKVHRFAIELVRALAVRSRKHVVGLSQAVPIGSNCSGMFPQRAMSWAEVFTKNAFAAPATSWDIFC